MTQLDKETLLKEYLAGNSTQNIADKYLVSKTTINRYLHKTNCIFRSNGEQHRKDFFNETYFSGGIKSVDHAYILGLLYSDGYNNEKHNIVKLDLKSNDIEILQKIKSVLNSSQEIKIYLNKTDKGDCEIGRLRFTSSRFSEDLAKLGCIQKKSLVLTYPEKLPDSLFFHFLRGYFDGDGSLILTHTKYFDPSISIIGTPLFLSQVKEKLNLLLNVNSYIAKTPNPKTVSLRIKGTRQLDLLLSNLYENSNLRLNRKHEKYQLYLQKCLLLARWKTNRPITNIFKTHSKIVK
jgi:intein-encoded DNA endonuclease-like protein